LAKSTERRCARRGSPSNRKIAEFGAINLEGDIEPRKVEAFTRRKSNLQEAITGLQKEKAQRKATPRHIPFKELPPEARFDRLSTQSKHLIDTIKMIAYCAGGAPKNGAPR
jgi:hypothetical protein